MGPSIGEIAWGVRQFLVAFAKLRKATISFAMSFRPSVRMERLGSHDKDFHEIWYLKIFRKSVERIIFIIRLIHSIIQNL